jgi:multisubunit Na+/H+ antiporter MnhG subunit
MTARITAGFATACQYVKTVNKNKVASVALFVLAAAAAGYTCHLALLPKLALRKVVTGLTTMVLSGALGAYHMMRAAYGTESSRKLGKVSD